MDASGVVAVRVAGVRPVKRILPTQPVKGRLGHYPHLGPGEKKKQ